NSSISTLCFFFLFFLYYSFVHRHLHSFPTRRSSDLKTPREELKEGALGIQFYGEKPTEKDTVQVFNDNGNIYIRAGASVTILDRSEEHTSELQSRFDLVCRLLLEKKKKYKKNITVTT